MGKIKEFLYRMFYSVGANAIGLLVSVLVTLLVPKFLGEEVEQYGYFKMYLLYVSYIGLFHFGWSDGILLRDGGKRYNDLDKKIYSSQFWLLVLLEVLVSFLIGIVGKIGDFNKDTRFIIVLLALNLLVYLPSVQLTFILQSTNRIKEYASITTGSRLLYVILTIIIILVFEKDYKWFIWADFIGKMFGLLIAVWWCRDIVFRKPISLAKGIWEAWCNISVGSKVLLANIASMLINGIVQMGIQIKWDVSTFGKISFSIGVSNLMLTFINAIAVVLYPTLRQVNERKLYEIYNYLRNILMIFVLGSMIVFYPICKFLSTWLPQYAESLQYMAILFPVCIYAAKMSLIVQTYMNVYRLEKKMLRINIVGAVLAVIATICTIFIFENLTLAMFSIVINQIFRCVYAERELARHMNLSIGRDAFVEFAMTCLFIVVNWYIGGWLGTVLYFLGYILYLVSKRKQLRSLSLKTII